MPIDLEPNGDRLSVNGKDVALLEDIESGSSANSYWVKFPDGTLIQYGEYESLIPIPENTIVHSGTVNFPISFITMVSVTVSLRSFANAYGYIGKVTTVSTSDVTFEAFNKGTTNAEGNLRVYWQAMGRWK